MRCRRRVIGTGIGLLAMLASVSCGEDVSSSPAPVVIVVDLEAGQRWAVHGGAVEQGRICEDGFRHVRDGIDPATNEVVPVRIWTAVIADAIESRNTTELTMVVEYTCADGSGSFVITEHWGPDQWSLDSGTGAYRALHGGGDLSFTTDDYMSPRPLRLELDGVLEP